MQQLNKKNYKICIVGAGFGGIAMAIRLLQQGIQDFIILEKSHDIGGTWRDNQYPGAACDVQSHLYSLSFAPKANWSQRYAHAEEIFAYLKQLVEEHQLETYCSFHSQLIGSTYLENECLWQLQLQDGRQLHCQFLICATGPLHLPHIPSIKGIEKFQGKVFHSAQWDHHYNFAHKSVASIGTGASAVQFIPHLAVKAQQLYVFQRNAAWVLPRDDRPYFKIEQKLFQQNDWLRKFHRNRLYWSNELRFITIKHPKYMQYLKKLSLALLHYQIKDPKLIAQLTPNYEMGCKRILLSNHYYPSFKRNNVELVSDTIQEITADSIITQDGQARKIDCLVYATGFITNPQKYLKHLHCIGMNGVELNEQWKNGVTSYYGICTKGFPNFFQLLGPNTVLAHNSVVFMIEAQVNYILKLIDLIQQRGAHAAVVKATAQDQFNQELQQHLQQRVWQSGCSSWYQAQDGQNFALWPDYTWQYWLQTRQPKANDYHFLQKN